jgi:O-antigen/teichoic acid export membrane protein
MDFQGTWILMLLLAFRLAANFIQVVLDGQQLVHISSVLTPVESASRSIAQICLVLAGTGVIGALAGYAVGAIAGTIIGIYFVSIHISKPTKREFHELKSYAQFSWLSRIRGRTFLSMDTLILAVFVSNSLVAAYEIAWNLASLFSIFSSSIRRTLFPEISKLSSQNESDSEVSELLRVSLLYSGLFIIPGLVGGALVGDIVLRIYGSGFTQAYYILLILTFARLLYGYQGQFLTVLNAIDKPNITFRINIVFVITNLVLNLILTSQYGWYGAAVATTISATVGLSMSYSYTRNIMTVPVPLAEVGKQCVAAFAMAVVVFPLRIIFGIELPIVIGIIGIGAGIYFATLLSISKEFRTAVLNNIPIETAIL